MALPELLANNFITTLNGAITSGTNPIVVHAAAPALLQTTGQFRLVIDTEVLIVTAGGSGTSWTVTRGAEGTGAASHADGATVAHVITADSIMAWRSSGDNLQNGVLASGDGAASTISVNSATAAITATIAAGNAWVTEPVSSALARNAVPSGSITLTPGTTPATGKFATVGIDLVAATAGAAPAIALSTKGTDQTTSALAQSNSPATASGRLRLWDVVIQNVSGTFSTTANRDRRPRAAGAYYQYQRTAGGFIVPTTYTSMSLISGSNDAGFKRRIECSGAPLRVTVNGHAVNNTGANNTLFAKLQVDGADLTASEQQRGILLTTAFVVPFALSWDWVPAAGSHLLDPFIKASSAASFGFDTSGDGTSWLTIVIEELTGRYSADNGLS